MFDLLSLDEAALSCGFRRKGKQNWFRRTIDFIQIVNFQKSMWDGSDFYINFALWPLALGEPEKIVEYKFMFRVRAGALGAKNPNELFSAAENLRTLGQLKASLASGELQGLMDRRLAELLGHH